MTDKSISDRIDGAFYEAAVSDLRVNRIELSRWDFALLLRLADSMASALSAPKSLDASATYKGVPVFEGDQSIVDLGIRRIAI